MSIQPIKSPRDDESSPPIKNRKALSDQTNTVMHSPLYNSKKKHINSINSFKLPPPAPLFDTTKQQLTIQRPSNIPGHHSNVRERLQRYSHAGAALERTTAEKTSRRLSHHSNSNNIELQSLKDPAALKKQQLNLQNIQKMVGVLREKLSNTQLKKEQAEAKIEELKVNKNKLTRSAIEYRNKISDAQMSLDRSEHKTIMARDQLEKLKITEKHMNLLKLEQLRNTTEEQLSEFEQELRKELHIAESFKDDAGNEKIKTLKTKVAKREEDLRELNESNNKKLEKRKIELQTGLDAIILEQELKDDEFSKKYEKEALKLETVISSVELARESLKKLNECIKELDSDIKKEEELNKFSKMSNDDLLKELQQLKLQNTELQSHVDRLSQEEAMINETYQQGSSKLHKEKKLRYRIQNSIEELEGKLRVYVRVIDRDSKRRSKILCNKEDNNLTQTITIDNRCFTFDKVFSTNQTDDDVLQEMVNLTENNLYGGNVSYIFNGYEQNQIITKFVSSTRVFLGLLETKDRYKENGWVFNYTFQLISITEEGAFDLVTGSNAEFKIQDRQIISNASLITDHREIKPLLEQSMSSDSSILIKFIVNASNSDRSFTATTNILNIPFDEGANLVLKVTKKIDEGNYSASNSEILPVYQLVHHLYANTKSLSFFNITDDIDDTENNLKILNAASFIHSVNAAPPKKVYSNKVANL